MKTAIFTLTLLLTLTASVPSWSQDPLDTTRLASELGVLASAVDRLTKQLEEEKQQREDDVRFRKLDLAISYLNFRSRRIEALEREISDQRNLRSRIEENLPILSERLRDLELRMQEYPQGPPQELQDAHDDLLAQQELFRDRIARIDDELVMKENLMYELQNQIRDVEEYVQQHLDM